MMRSLLCYLAITPISPLSHPYLTPISPLSHPYQVDCAMMRWVLPACVDDEGSVLALLDEVLVSCQDRSHE